VPVTLRRRGEPRDLPAAADQAAYRMVEEGLTNAAKHAPGRPVTVSAEWEPDALLLTVTNPVPYGPEAETTAEHGPTGPHGPKAETAAAPGPVAATTTEHRPTGLAAPTAGYGLTGLGERVRLAGGLLDRGPSGGTFRLFAMLPAAEPEDDEPPAIGRARTVWLGVATAVLMFGLVPASMLAGVK
jgi:hypothetical protein